MIHAITVGRTRFTSLEILSSPRPIEEVRERFPDVSATDIAHATGNADSLVWSFNLSLFEVGDRVILADTGFHFDGGGPAASTKSLLAEAGYEPGQVDEVVITHGHGDHVGGLLHDGEPAFPRATLTMAAAEHAFWMGDDALATRSEEAVKLVCDSIAAYDGRLRLLTDGEVIHEENGAVLTSVPIPGHTPGHIGLELSDDGESITALVDTFHVAFQLWDLSWCPSFDTDRNRSIAARREQVTRAATTGKRLHLYHLPFPGIGYIREAGDRWAWEATSDS